MGKNLFEKKSHNPEKKLKGGPSPGMVCYTEKEEKLFWFSSLGQMSQFGTIKLCRTFRNYFGQFVWIENQSLICGKGVGLSLFPSDSLSFESYEQFVRKSKKSKNGCFLAIFGLILAMFLTSQPYDFDAFAHAGAPLGVE